MNKTPDKDTTFSVGGYWWIYLLGATIVILQLRSILF